ncbi:hypothetical protein KJ671_00905 [Patescibacteria group bacterium]|nr:hypothetical protein [Patescibacteria group bacterium]
MTFYLIGIINWKDGSDNDRCFNINESFEANTHKDAVIKSGKIIKEISVECRWPSNWNDGGGLELCEIIRIIKKPLIDVS